MAENSVQVAVRCRPLSAKEVDGGATQCVEIEENSVTIGAIEGSNNQTPSRKRGPKEFVFDFCYGEKSTQEEVFTDIGQAVLENAFSGYNASVFAYGQTGSGKTHTMLGGDGEEAGLIPRICNSLVEMLAQNSPTKVNAINTAASTRYKLEASYLEIYNEKCIDLLASSKKDDQQNLRVREHPKRGPYVESLTSVEVHGMKDIGRMMAVGARARTVAATNMNSKSSRSHAIFTLLFTQTNIASDLRSATDTVSKIHLVDLAGSERVSASGVQGKHLKEAANINRSLHTLGRVINALSRVGERLTNTGSNNNKENQASNNSEVIPYRDSTLTWLLKPSLGGNSKTTMLATVSPACYNHEESLTTLRYAQECSRVVNRAVVNRDANNQVITELRTEIDLLRERLAQQTETSNAMLNLNEELQQHKERVEIENQESKKKIEEVGVKHTRAMKILESEWLKRRRQLEQENQDKQVKVDQLLVEKTALEEHISIQASALEDTSQAIQDLETKCSELNQTLSEQAMELAGSRLELQQTAGKLSKEQTKNTDLETTQKRMHEQIQEEQQKLENAKDQLKSLQNDKAILEENYKEQTITLAETSTKLESCNQKLNELSFALEESKERETGLQEELKRANSESKLLNSANATLEKKLSQRNIELTAANSEISELKTCVSERDLFSKGLGNELDSVKKELEKTDGELQTVHSKVGDLETCVKTKDQTITELEIKKASVESTLDETSKELSKILATVDDRNAEIGKLKISRDELQNAKVDLEKKLTEAETNVASSNDYISNLVEKISQKSIQIGELENAKSSLGAQLEDVTQQVATLQESEKELQTRKVANEQEINTLSELKKKLSESLAATSEKLDQTNAELVECRSRLTCCEEEAGNLRNAKSALETNLNQANAELDENKARVETLNIDVQSKATRIDELEVDIKSLREQCTALSETVTQQVAQLATNLTEVESQTVVIQDLTLKNKELEVSTEDMQSLLTMQKHDIARYKGEIESLTSLHEQSLRDAEENVKRLGDAHDAKAACLGAEIQSHQEEIAVLKQQQIQQSGKWFDLNTRHEHLTAEYEKLEGERKELDAEKVALGSQNSLMESKILGLESGMTVLEEKLSQLDTERTTLEGEKSKLARELGGLKERYTLLENSNVKLNRECEHFQMRQEDALCQMKVLSERVFEERKQIEVAQNRVVNKEKLQEETEKLMLEDRVAVRLVEKESKEKLDDAQRLSAKAEADCRSADEAMKQVAQKEQNIDQRETNMEQTMQRNVRLGMKACMTELMFRQETRRSMDLMVSLHRGELEKSTKKHNDAIQQLQLQFATERHNLIEKSLDLKRQLIEEKELREKDALRFSSLFHEEEKDLESQISTAQAQMSQAQEQVEKLQTKLNQAKVERETSEVTLKQVQVKLQEKEAKLEIEELSAFKCWLCSTGLNLLKYPRNGKKAKCRHIHMSKVKDEEEDHVVYTIYICQSYGRRISMIDSFRSEKKIELTPEMTVQQGCDSETFRRATISPNPATCFSITASDRTYDFQCSNEEQCQKLVRGFTLLLKEINHPGCFDEYMSIPEEHCTFLIPEGSISAGSTSSFDDASSVGSSAPSTPKKQSNGMLSPVLTRQLEVPATPKATPAAPPHPPPQKTGLLSSFFVRSPSVASILLSRK
mmetsp:Transcript_6424/g.11117  ORF Transcript_6424/g.11117 Transcript_6424/m.11117 type:complete len:1661 (+) Transcript_6424:2667-7649(+)|eukprot:CAMPEP_0203747298 /NCGR_PEP_ID=MMETSP0098-20131031/2481_1 /ASSEMBLY_ACC=CAM_ASM_000208 /TAXON_ID=96639 /ORGANISM=" , Strain NY0313808BC1" /LENGTH=1660 /DNA_ID=CAMNT_0050635677 /DNA_START=2612 /DNA_END=7594 /DNA_ORIENTATION=+